MTILNAKKCCNKPMSIMKRHGESFLFCSNCANIVAEVGFGKYENSSDIDIEFELEVDIKELNKTSPEDISYFPKDINLNDEEMLNSCKNSINGIFKTQEELKDFLIKNIKLEKLVA